MLKRVNRESLYTNSQQMIKDNEPNKICVLSIFGDREEKKETFIYSTNLISRGY